MREEVEVKVERLYDESDGGGGVQLPSYSHEDDSGMDVRAYFSDDWMKEHHPKIEQNFRDDIIKYELYDSFRKTRLSPQSRKIIPTGLKVAIPNGYEIQVRPRSGKAFKEGVTVLNTPGTVDAGYRGEIGIILCYIDHEFDNIPLSVQISHGDRIAQLVLQKVPKVVWNEVKSVDETERSEGGFGSTGDK